MLVHKKNALQFHQKNKAQNFKLALTNILQNSVSCLPNFGAKKASHHVCAKKPCKNVGEIYPTF